MFLPFMKTEMVRTLLWFLLLLSGDVESNPGPPRRVPSTAVNNAPKGPTKEDQVEQFLQKSKEYEEKFEHFEKELEKSQEEIKRLQKSLQTYTGIEGKIESMKQQMNAITETYDELHEKMHEIDKTRKNNLLFYGIKADFQPEIPSQLEKQIQDIFRFSLGISRDIPLMKLSRMITGPEVRGCKPVLVNFCHWKDREEVLRLSKLLKGSNIYITEDLSRKMREQRNELNKFMRTVRSRSPQKKCVLRQDKLYIDNDVYIYDEEKNAVVPSISQRLSGPARLYYGSTNHQVQSGLSLIRSASVHSVHSTMDDKENPGSQRFASTESLDFRPEKTESPKAEVKINGRETPESPSKEAMPTIVESTK